MKQQSQALTSYDKPKKKKNLDISMEIAWKTKVNMEVSKNLAADSDESVAFNLEINPMTYKTVVSF